MAHSSKDSTKKVFDISSPATTPPSATSRPLIVGHGAIMKDPTIIDNNESTESAEPSEPTEETHHQLNIAPAENTKEEKGDTNEELDSSKKEFTLKKELNLQPSKNLMSSLASSTPKPDISPPVAVEPKEEDKAPVQAAPSPSDINTKTDINSTTLTPEEKKVSDQAELEAQAAKESKINDLVEKKTYFLSINRLEQKRNSRLIIIGIIICLLLVVVWLDVALDAGLISNTFKLPHTHFFSLKN